MKFNKKQMNQYKIEWHEHTRNMRRKHLYDFIYPTLEEFIKNKFGFKDKSDCFKDLAVKSIYRRTCDCIDSKSITSTGDETAVKENLRYTGSFIKGISLTHKSNLVPVTSQEQAIDIAHMRR